jgi:hypothetical protein
MKSPNTKLLVLTLTLGLTFSNCRKKMDLPKPELETTFGTWEWLGSSGGFSGKSISPKTEGFTKTIEFKENGICFFYVNKKKDKMAYTLTEGPSIFSSFESTLIKYNDIGVFDKNSAPGLQSVRFIGKDTLLLNDECFDCFGHTYIRKN